MRLIEKCIRSVKAKQAMDISIYETSFLEKVIQTRMTALSVSSMDDYLLALEEMPDESGKLIHHLSNSYSEFFRNPLTFIYLEQMILPGLIHQKISENEKAVRIWSAACASGQEAYSVAILFDELVKSTNAAIDCHIFATDINPDELDKARRGIYETSSMNKVTLKRIKTYFVRHGEKYVVVPALGKYIDFSIFNLLSQQYNCPPASIYGNFDIIFCTNILFYYNAESRQRIIHKAGNCLAQGGYLITGETESEMMKENNYREVYVNSGIFQKR